jgi:hypothetical protein
LTKTRNGYASPGFTQPTEETKVFSSTRSAGGVESVTKPAVSAVAFHAPVVRLEEEASTSCSATVVS